jgi:DNA-binding response OmpR family regulator
MYSATPQPRPVILLIEGLQNRYAAMTEAFEAEGFSVARARTVADAMIQARDCRPDLVVIDPGPAASVTRELNRLRSDPATAELPLIVMRSPGAYLDQRNASASMVRGVDVDLLLEHLRRVVQPASLHMQSSSRIPA